MNYLWFLLISSSVMFCIGCETNPVKSPYFSASPQSQIPQDVQIRDIRETLEQKKREEFEKRIAALKREISALEEEKRFTIRQLEYVRPGARPGDFALLNREPSLLNPLTTPRPDKEINEWMKAESADGAVGFMKEYPEWGPAARTWKNRYEQWKWLEAHVTSLTNKIADLKGELTLKQAELRGLHLSVILLPGQAKRKAEIENSLQDLAAEIKELEPSLQNRSPVKKHLAETRLNALETEREQLREELQRLFSKPTSTQTSTGAGFSPSAEERGGDGGSGGD